MADKPYDTQLLGIDRFPAMIISAPEWGYNSCVDLFLFRMFEAGSLLSLEPRTLLVERGFNLSESIWRALKSIEP